MFTFLCFGFTLRNAPAPTCDRWEVSAHGLHFIDRTVGARMVPACPGVLYNLSVHDTGALLHSSGTRAVPIDANASQWNAIVDGMSLGGHRTLLLSASDIDGVLRVPSKRGSALTLDVELVDVTWSRFAPTRRGLLLLLYMLSFVPYLLPAEDQPSLYHRKEADTTGH